MSSPELNTMNQDVGTEKGAISEKAASSNETVFHSPIKQQLDETLEAMEKENELMLKELKLQELSEVNKQLKHKLKSVNKDKKPDSQDIVVKPKKSSSSTKTLDTMRQDKKK